MSTNALNNAVTICGSQAALAAKIGVTQQVISYWATKARFGVPAEFAIPIEKATDGAVPRHEIRPDIYPPPAPQIASE